MAQLVARYLGVVEAASSSLVTQTKIGGSIEPPIFFCFLAKSLEISASGQTCGQRRKTGLFNPQSREEQAHYQYQENLMFSYKINEVLDLI